MASDREVSFTEAAIKSCKHERGNFIRLKQFKEILTNHTKAQMFKNIPVTELQEFTVYGLCFRFLSVVFVNIIKRTLHIGSKTLILFPQNQRLTCSLRSLVRCYFFLLEHKIRNFSPSCDTLFLIRCCKMQARRRQRYMT